jgi:hypothetical protein
MSLAPKPESFSIASVMRFKAYSHVLEMFRPIFSAFSRIALSIRIVVVFLNSFRLW